MKKSLKQLNNIFLKPLQYGVMALFCGTLLLSCSSGESESNATDAQEGTVAEEIVEDNGKGIGPVSSVEVGEQIDEALANEGKSIFDAKCTACHQLSDQKVVGPGLAGVTERRKPEWIMNMIFNPEEMTKKDPVAKKLFAEHLIQMVNQDVTEQDARAILEYLRQNDQSS